MDTHLGLLYLRAYETARYTPEPGETSTPGGSPVEGGQAVSRRGNGCQCVAALGRTMAASIPKRGQAGTACEAFSGPNASVEPTTEGTLGPTAFAGAAGGWIFDQPLDPSSYQRSHSSGVRHQLYHTECLEADAGNGLELPNTRQTGSGAQRTGDPVLETSRMASHKKKPQHLEPIWASSMRVDSCLCRRSPAHGLPKGLHRSFRQRAIGRRSQPFPLSPSLRRRGDLDCIVGFIQTKTFVPRRWFSSWSISYDTCEAMWCFSGIAAQHTGPKLSLSS